MKNLNYSSTLTVVGQSYTFGFDLVRCGAFVVLKLASESERSRPCYSCNVDQRVWPARIRAALTDLGIPETTPAIIVWPGEAGECWSYVWDWEGNRIGIDGEGIAGNGIVIREYQWRGIEAAAELVGSYPATLEDVAVAGGKICQARADAYTKAREEYDRSNPEGQTAS